MARLMCLAAYSLDFGWQREVLSLRVRGSWSFDGMEAEMGQPSQNAWPEKEGVVSTLMNKASRRTRLTARRDPLPFKFDKSP